MSSVEPPWAVKEAPPGWMKMMMEAESWPVWALESWRKRLGDLRVDHVNLSRTEDKAFIDLDRDAFTDLDPDAEHPLDDSLVRATRVLEAKEAHRGRTQ